MGEKVQQLSWLKLCYWVKEGAREAGGVRLGEIKSTKGRKKGRGGMRASVNVLLARSLQVLVLPVLPLMAARQRASPA
jgi:hypothetical protein